MSESNLGLACADDDEPSPAIEKNTRLHKALANERPELQQAAVNMLTMGFNQRQAAQSVGVNPVNLCRWLKKIQKANKKAGITKSALAIFSGIILRFNSLEFPKSFSIGDNKAFRWDKTPEYAAYKAGQLAMFDKTNEVAVLLEPRFSPKTPPQQKPNNIAEQMAFAFG
jgi:hypothetical protein